jgi:Dipeptidyl peptidase IV (DPP IV) N-terminal region
MSTLTQKQIHKCLLLVFVVSFDHHISPSINQGKADPHHVETHRYPFAGQPNPLVKLAVAFLPPPVAVTQSPVHTVPIEQSSVIRSDDGVVLKWLELVVAKEEINNETSSTATVITSSTPTPPASALAAVVAATEKQPQPTHSSTDQQHFGSNSSSSSSSSSSLANHLFHDDGNIHPEDFYIARVGWWPDNSIMIQIQNRRQTVLQLLRIDPRTGQREVIIVIKHSFPYLFYFLSSHVSIFLSHHIFILFILFHLILPLVSSSPLLSSLCFFFYMW